jgi:hypothetical protein
MIDAFPSSLPGPEVNSIAESRPIESEARLIIRRIVAHGTEEKRMMATILESVRTKPSARQAVTRALFNYAQVRHLHTSVQQLELRSLCEA